MNSSKGKGKNLFFCRKEWCSFCKKEVNKIFEDFGMELKRLKGVSFEEVENAWKYD